MTVEIGTVYFGMANQNTVNVKNEEAIPKGTFTIRVDGTNINRLSTL
jgi:hypothetical protein